MRSNITAEASDKHAMVCPRQQQEILKPFLRKIMETFSFREGQLIILERNAHVLLLSTHIAGPYIPELDPEKAERLISGYLDVSGQKSVPMSVCELRDPNSLSGPEFPFLIFTAFILVIDEALVGILALGWPQSSLEIGGDDIELLRGRIEKFMVRMRDAGRNGIQGPTSSHCPREAFVSRAVSTLPRDRQEGALSEAEGSEVRVERKMAEVADQFCRFKGFDLMLLLCISIMIGILHNTTNPHGVRVFPAILQGHPVVSLAHSWEMLIEPEIMIIDARPPALFEQKRIPGAINLPSGELFDFIYSMHMAEISPCLPLLVYGRTFSKRYDMEVVSHLQSLGHCNLSILDGSIEQWQKGGNPVEPM
jgi:hypothetical protein